MIGNYESEFDKQNEIQMDVANEFRIRGEEVLHTPIDIKNYKLPRKLSTENSEENED